jgi:hypothetical protein
MFVPVVEKLDCLAVAYCRQFYMVFRRHTNCLPVRHSHEVSLELAAMATVAANSCNLIVIPHTTLFYLSLLLIKYGIQCMQFAVKSQLCAFAGMAFKSLGAVIFGFFNGRYVVHHIDCVWYFGLDDLHVIVIQPASCNFVFGIAVDMKCWLHTNSVQE